MGDLAAQHIDGNRQVGGSRTAAGSGAEGCLELQGNSVGAVDGGCELAQRPGESHGVHVLEVAATNGGRVAGARDEQHRRAVEPSVADAGERVEVGDAGADGDHANLAGQAARGVGHVGRALLVAGVDDPHPVLQAGLEQRVEPVPAEGVDAVDVAVLEFLDEYVGSVDH